MESVIGVGILNFCIGKNDSLYFSNGMWWN